MSSPPAAPRPLTLIDWLIILVAIIGFAFDTYVLLTMPLIAGPALAELLHVAPSDPQVRQWIGYIFWGSALSGGAFGLLGGWLTDRLGRRRVLVWSILIYSISALGGAYSTSAAMLCLFRCTTFVGVCVEFVAAVAWLAELFPNAAQREKVLGYTQAFASVGGLLVTVANTVAVKYATTLPALAGSHASWRYTLLSGLLPAIPLLVIRPFLPESPAWREKRAQGTLQRPSFAALFAPELRRTTVVTTILFACAYGAAFGAIQLTPTQIVPGLPGLAEVQKPMKALRQKEGALRQALQDPGGEAAAHQRTAAELKSVLGQEKAIMDQVKQAGNRVQFFQETGGLVGRVVLAFLAVRIVGRGRLLRLFLVPGLILLPLVFLFPGRQNLELLKYGMFAAGFLTVAQFSFWGNYLPRVYPMHLRGTGESFAANLGGRMLGTSAAFVTTSWFAPLMPGASSFSKVAYAAALMAFLVYGIALVASWWLPEPPAALLPD